jgi:hypothetical protein
VEMHVRGYPQVYAPGIWFSPGKARLRELQREAPGQVPRQPLRLQAQADQRAL